MTADLDLAPYAQAFGDRAEQLRTAEASLALLEGAKLETEKQYLAAGEWLRQCKAVGKTYEEKRKAITQPLNTAKREVDSWFKPIVETYARAEAILKRKILEYQAEQARAKAALQPAIVDAHSRGDVGGVMAIAAHAQTLTPQPIAGTSVRKILKWRIVDFEAIPHRFLAIDPGAVRDAAARGEAVPGLEFYHEDVLAVRA